MRSKPDENAFVLYLAAMKRRDEVGEKPDVGPSIGHGSAARPALVKTSDAHGRDCPFRLPIYEREMNKSRCGILELMHKVYPAVRARETCNVSVGMGIRTRLSNTIVAN